jgi:hypothetical protein
MRACAPLAYALVTGGWLSGGCYDSTAFDKLTHGSATEASESGGGSGSGGDTAQPPTSSTTAEPTTAADDTTEATTGVATTGGTESPDDLPTVSLKAAPLMLAEAGPVALDVDHSQDVTALELFDNGEYQLGWKANEPDPEYLITTNGEDGVHALQVRAINGDDDDAYSNVVVVTTKLPPAGSALWTKALDLDEPNQGRDLTSAIGTSGSVELLLGVDVVWEGVGARLNAEGEPALVVKPVEPALSSIGGIAHGPKGEAIIVGTEFTGSGTRPWIARFDPLGDLLGLTYGKLGDATTGVAVDPASGRVYVSGYRHTPNMKGSFDAMLWARADDDSVAWEVQWERPLPVGEVQGAATDLAWGAVTHANVDPNEPADVVVVGETQLVVGNEAPRYRAFARRYTAKGELLAEWRSSTPPYKQAGARAALPTESGLLVGGWSSANPAERRGSTIFFFTPLLELEVTHIHGDDAVFEEIRDLGRLPDGEYVYVTNVDIDAAARHDAEVRALRTPAGQFIWKRVIDDADEVRGNALTVTPHGHVVVLSTGYAGISSKITLSAYHP